MYQIIVKLYKSKEIKRYNFFKEINIVISGMKSVWSKLKISYWFFHTIVSNSIEMVHNILVISIKLHKDIFCERLNNLVSNND